MNLTKLKNYAPIARTAIITAVTRRAAILGIQPGRVEEVTESGDVALIGGQPFPRSIVPLRKQLLDLIHRDGFDHTMEAMAYTWFNRLVALRFMELHDGYLDHGYRVLSHPQGTPLPEILQHAEHVSLKGLDREEVIRLKLDGNRDEELYRLLLLAQCAELNQILPDVFSKLDDVTILLLPENLLHSDSVIRQLVAGSDAEDWQEVEVLGWLYQFYISEKKDAVMARKSAVPTDDIPAVTQLFTPHWIVRYLVENSLGRLWLLNRPGSRLREHMPYYIEGETETDFLKISKPEEIRLCDPAVGSGHMLTYAFDLLTLIYEEEGYAANDIPGLILKHNLHGLDLCPRAAQLAELALVFKAREKSRRFFSPGNLVRPHIIELRDVRFAENELRDYIHALGLGDLFNQPMLRLLHQFEEAKNFGSLIHPCLSETEIVSSRKSLSDHWSLITDHSSGQIFLRETHLKVLRVLEQAEALTQRYHVVVANPPYMGGRYMGKTIKAWAATMYQESKADSYAMFIQRSKTMTLCGGYFALITMQNWMFLRSFVDLRKSLFTKSLLVSMFHTGPGVFPDLGAFNVLTTAFVFSNILPKANQKVLFIKANEGPEIQLKMAAITDPSSRRLVEIGELQAVPEFPIVYWLSSNAIRNFKLLPLLGDVCPPYQGMATTNNDLFVRRWSEVSLDTLNLNASSEDDAEASGKKWFPYNKGGDYRKWFGNNDHVVNFENRGKTICDYIDATPGVTVKSNGRVINREKYFKPGIVYSLFGWENFGVRYKDQGFVFDVSGSSIFPAKNLYVTLAFLCSNVAFYYLKALAPTVNFQVGDLRRLPLPEFENEKTNIDLASLAKSNIDLCRADWDAWETSWGFATQPFLAQNQPTIQEAWNSIEQEHNRRRDQLKSNEERINEILIREYHLDGDVSPEVIKRDLSIKPTEQRESVAAFLSYAVGCMMGRYSPDHPGLILANAGDSLREFLEKVGKPLAELTFAPDEDGIIPVLDGEWFEDDIVARTRDFLRATFGEATLNENIRFIEESLGKELRTYFLNDFYKDHLQTYKNRPIYWQLSSGKQKAFQCLVYLHRYTPATLARIRTEYAIPLQGKLSARITRLEEDVIQTASSAARKKLQTDLDKCKKQIVELLAFDEQLRSYADQAITLDLDDGVKANYAKFGTLVAEPKKVCGTKEDGTL